MMLRRLSGKLSFLMSLALILQLVLPSASVLAATDGTDSTMLPPSNLAYQVLTPDDVKLTWSAVFGASGYNVYGITDGQLIQLGATTSTSYTFNNLEEGAYQYVVSTLNGTDESGPCAPITVDIVYPGMAAPATLTYLIQNGNDIVLNWGASQYAESYNVYEIKPDGQATLAASVTARTQKFINVPAGPYTYAVSSVNSKYGESPLSASVLIEMVFPIMAAPQNLTSTVANVNDVTLKWSAVAYAASYKIYQIVDGEKVLKSTATGTSAIYSNMPAGNYTYEVHSYSDRFGESADGSQVSFTAGSATMTAPSNFAYKIQNTNDAVLTWGAVTYANSYKIYQVVDGQKVLKSTVTGTTVTYTKVPAGDYVYEIHSYSDKFGESADGSQVAFAIGTVTMVPPGDFAYQIQNGNDIVLTWGTASSATAYKIYQIIDGQQVLKSTVTGTTVTYAKAPYGDYVYEIHSYSDRFGESVDGSRVSFTLGTVTMVPPTNLTFKVQNGNDIVLTWDPALNATSYKIYQLVNGQKVLKSTVTGTTGTYVNLPAGDYTYEIHSYSTRFGESLDGTQLTLSLVHPSMQPPTNFVQKIIGATSFSLSWDAAQYATSYKVYQIIDGQKVLKSTLAVRSVTYTNMQPGDYTFEVHSVSTRFGESVEGSLLTMTLNGQTMQEPINPTYSIAKGNDITLKWTGVPYANSYKVYQVVDGQKVLASTVTGTTVTYPNKPAGDYDYFIHSYSTLLGESPNGAEVQFTLVWPTMAAPGSFAYKVQNGNDIVLTWGAVPYATSYKVYELVDGQEVLKTSGTALSATITNVPDGIHTYVVHSYSTRFGESPEGSQVAVPLNQVMMLPPANLTYSIASGNDITLRWTASTYAESYNVYQIVDGQKILNKSVTTTAAILTNMPAGDYSFEVKAYSTRFGESPEGSLISFTLNQVTMLPPGNLTYSIANGNDITLKWSASTYANSYNVYQVIDGQKTLKNTLVSGTITYPNMPAGDYSFEVKAYSTRFGESPEASPISFTLDQVTMLPPGNLTYSITNGNDITLKWSASTYANNYRIYQVIDGQKVLKSTVTGLAAKYINMPAGDYSYEVRSYSSRFGESEQASTVEFALVWPVVQPPTLQGQVFNANNITLSWQAVTWANEYRLYEVTGSGRQLLYKGKALTFKVFNLTEDTHSYEVTAYNTRFGESASSNRIVEPIIYPIMQPPVAKLNLLSPTSARISWNFITYANGYNVYEIVNGEPVLLTENLNNLSYTINDLSYADHEFFVTSYSNSFGESDVSNTVIAKLIVDTEPPVTTCNAPLDWTKQNPVTVSLTATDDETGVAGTYFSVNDGEFIAGNTLVIDKEGTAKISFYSVDKVGNTEATQTVYVKIDNQAPVTKASEIPDWADQPVTVNLTSTDNLSGVANTWYSIDDSGYTEGTSFTVAVEGIHNITFYSVDNAGNIELANTVEVKIDKTPPVVSMDLNSEYKLGTGLQLNYLAKDDLSGVANAQMTVFGPGETVGKIVDNGTVIQLDKPGVYKVIVTVTDNAGLSTTIQKEFLVFIPANIEVTPKVIKGNNGVFTVRVNLPEGFAAQGFDLNTATLNGVNALTSNNGYYNQAKLGQFKFERSSFNWTTPEVTVNFRCYVDGYLVVGQTTVKVQQ